MTNRELGRPMAGAQARARRRRQPRRPDREGRSRQAEPRRWSASRAISESGRGIRARARSCSSSSPTRRKQVGEAPVALDRLPALVKAQVEKFGAEGQEVAFTRRDERREGVADGEAGEETTE